VYREIPSNAGRTVSFRLHLGLLFGAIILTYCEESTVNCNPGLPQTMV